MCYGTEDVAAMMQRCDSEAEEATNEGGKRDQVRGERSCKKERECQNQRIKIIAIAHLLKTTKKDYRDRVINLLPGSRLFTTG